MLADSVSVSHRIGRLARGSPSHWSAVLDRSTIDSVEQRVNPCLGSGFEQEQTIPFVPI